MLDDGTLTISGTGNMDNYSHESGLPPWYSLRKSIKRVVISDGVTSIGEQAFSGCLNLTSVAIPNSVTTIDDAAFCGCLLTSVTIPASVKEVGNSAFYACDSLETIYYPAGTNFVDKLRKGNVAELIPY